VDPEVESVLDRLRSLGSPEAVEGMKRYGVGGARAFGVRAPDMRMLARLLGTNHQLALRLWSTGWREARLVAAMVADPAATTSAAMDSWAMEIDSWDVCDGVCNELFRRTPFAWSKSLEWSRSEEIYVKRAGFVLMAQLAVHDKATDNERFVELLAVIERRADEGRPMVAKGINWALRQIGKRNGSLRLEALAHAERIRARPEGRARWIGSDAVRELSSPAVIRRTDRR